MNTFSLIIDRFFFARSIIYLFNLALKVLTLHKVGDIILIIILLLTTLALLHVLIALGELAEGSEAVGAELVQDARDELGELLLLAVAVEGEGVGGDGGVDFIVMLAFAVFLFSSSTSSARKRMLRVKEGLAYRGGWQSGSRCRPP